MEQACETATKAKNELPLDTSSDTDSSFLSPTRAQHHKQQPQCPGSSFMMTSPSLIETVHSDDSSCRSTRRIQHDNLSLYPRLPHLESLSPQKPSCQEPDFWWQRMHNLTLNAASSRNSEDHVVEESSLLASVAECNAFEIKQALEEWRTETTQASHVDHQQEDDTFSIVLLEQGNDTDNDEFYDALERVTVTTTVSSLADVTQYDKVETLARQLLEESNQQGDIAEQTAREMKQAMLEWRTQQQCQHDEPSREGFESEIDKNNTLMTSEEKSREVDVKKDSPNNYDNTHWHSKDEHCDTSHNAGGFAYEIPWDDTNLMEAHLMAQEQTSAVHVLCYETERMAELVKETIRDETATTMPQKDNRQQEAILEEKQRDNGGGTCPRPFIKVSTSKRIDEPRTFRRRGYYLLLCLVLALACFVLFVVTIAFRYQRQQHLYSTLLERTSNVMDGHAAWYTFVNQPNDHDGVCYE